MPACQSGDAGASQHAYPGGGGRSLERGDSSWQCASGARGNGRGAEEQSVNTQAVSVPPSGRPRPTIASPESLFAWPAPNVELTGRRREDARPGPQTMYRVPAARAWWPAVGAPVERRVRRQFPCLGSICSRSSRRGRMLSPLARRFPLASCRAMAVPFLPRRVPSPRLRNANIQERRDRGVDSHDYLPRPTKFLYDPSVGSISANKKGHFEPTAENIWRWLERGTILLRTGLPLSRFQVNPSNKLIDGFWLQELKISVLRDHVIVLKRDSSPSTWIVTLML
jgi:hypothetical protein